MGQLVSLLLRCCPSERKPQLDDFATFGAAACCDQWTPSMTPSGGYLIPDNQGTSPEEKYIIDPTPIGEGAFGLVRKATSRLHPGSSIAIKTMLKSAIKKRSAFCNEVSIQLALDHPNIVRMYEVFEDLRNVYLVAELCHGGELFDYFYSNGQRFSEHDAGLILSQMVSAIYYMHSHNIVHRDLKLENFLLAENGAPLEENTVKLIDFGVALRLAKGEKCHQFVGTVYYVAPEVCLGCYDCKCDVWSLGVLLYIMLSGVLPFDGDDAQIIEKIKEVEVCISGKRWDPISGQAKELVTQMFRKEPDLRISAEQVLNDSWLQMQRRHSLPDVVPTSSADCVAKLKKFSKLSEFKKNALNLIAHRVNDEDIQKLKVAFISLDANGDGVLTLEELQAGLDTAGIDGVDDLEKIFNQVDVHCNGHIDYSEFIAATIDQKTYLKEEACWEAFRVFARDGTGKISAEDLQEVMMHENVKTHTKEALTLEEAKAIIAEHDLAGEGRISFEDFMEMLKRSTAQ